MSKLQLRRALHNMYQAGYSHAHIARYLFDNRTWLPTL